MAERRCALPPNKNKGAKQMPLSLDLCHVDLTLECKHCGWPLIKSGYWFITAPRFKCEGCNRELRITYSEKVVLFEAHARNHGPNELS
jgi:hypothetical protein